MSPRSIEHGDKVAGCIITNADHKLFALYRTSRNWWELPGGKVKHGETTIEAAVREGKEETGAKVRVSGKEVHLPFQNNGINTDYYAYPVEVEEGVLYIAEQHIHGDKGWFTEQRLVRLRSLNLLSPVLECLTNKIIDGEVTL